MERWACEAFDQNQLKLFLSVWLKERRQERKSNPVDLGMEDEDFAKALMDLENNNFLPNLDLNLIRRIGKTFQIPDDEMQDLVRTACVSKLISLVTKLEDQADD